MVTNKRENRHTIKKKKQNNKKFFGDKVKLFIIFSTYCNTHTEYDVILEIFWLCSIQVETKQKNFYQVFALLGKGRDVTITQKS